MYAFCLPYNYADGLVRLSVSSVSFICPCRDTFSTECPFYIATLSVLESVFGLESGLSTLLDLDSDSGRFVTKSVFNFHRAHLQCTGIV